MYPTNRLPGQNPNPPAAVPKLSPRNRDLDTAQEISSRSGLPSMRDVARTLVAHQKAINALWELSSHFDRFGVTRPETSPFLVEGWTFQPSARNSSRTGWRLPSNDPLLAERSPCVMCVVPFPLRSLHPESLPWHAKQSTTCKPSSSAAFD